MHGVVKSVCNALHGIWRSKPLPLQAKLRRYEGGVCSVLSYGCEVWKLTPKLMATPQGWNARCLALITAWKLHANSVRDQTVDPAFDVGGLLRLYFELGDWSSSRKCPRATRAELQGRCGLPCINRTTTVPYGLVVHGRALPHLPLRAGHFAA